MRRPPSKSHPMLLTDPSHPPHIVDHKQNGLQQRRRPSNESQVSVYSFSSDESTISKKPRRRKRRQNHRNNGTQIPDRSQFVALDCEMVGVGPGGYASAAARITVINWFGDVLLDDYVKPTEPVTDYRTFVSGVTPQDLEDATLSLEECQRQVQELLKDKILVGHALKNDLKALGISHPWWQMRDTTKYEPFLQEGYDGMLWPRKLRDLAKEKLDIDIQVLGRPHSPYEDALAALDLYKVVRPKWEKLIEYKVAKTKQILGQQQLEGQPKEEKQ